MIQFKFEGIDYWSRPVFKAVESSTRIGSLDILAGDEVLKDGIVPYFQANKDKLCYFGNTFDEDDPMGNKLNLDKFEII